MTDRYYPKGYVPKGDPLESTYNEMNQMTTHERSGFPPGYSGHEHGAKFKFGYSIPAPSALPKQPIDGEDPLVNFRVGKKIIYEPLPNRKINLTTAAKPPPKVYATYRGVEEQKASLMTCDGKNASFIPQTSAYLASIGGNRGQSVPADCPYTPADYGRGTGFNSQSSYVSWLPPGKLEGSTTTSDAFPVPANMRRGLDCLEYTRIESPKKC